MESLRSRIGVVLQKAVLFKGTIEENLRWGNENATEEDLEEALAADGSNQKTLTVDAQSETSAVWIAGGKRIAFLREGQLWSMNADGTDRKQLTHSKTDIEGFLFSPDETMVILIKSIPYHGSIKENPSDLPKATGRLVTDMNYRHWDHYVESIPHPFLAKVTSEGVDEGDLFGVLPVALDGTETEESLSRKVAALVPSFVLPILLDENRKAYPQTGEATYTGFVSKDDGRIDFTKSAEMIHAQIRSCSPWPKAYAMLMESPLYLTGVWGSGFSIEKADVPEKAGTIVGLEKGKGLKIALKDGYIYINRVLPPMKKEMDAFSFVNGRRDVIGSILS